MPVDCVAYNGSYAVAAPRADRKSLVHAVASAEHGLTERDPVDAAAADPNKASEAVAQCYAFLCSNAMSFYFASFAAALAVPEHEYAYDVPIGKANSSPGTLSVGSTDLCANGNAIDGLAVIRSHWAAGPRADVVRAVELPEHRGSLVGADDSVPRRVPHEVAVDDQPDDTTVDLRAVNLSICHHVFTHGLSDDDAELRADELPVVRSNIMSIAVPEPVAQPATDVLAIGSAVASTVCCAVSFPVVYSLRGAVDTAESRAVAGSFQLTLVVALDITEPRTEPLAVSGAFGRAQRVADSGPDCAAVERALAGAHGLAVLRTLVDSIFLPDVQPVAHAVSLSVGVPIFRAVGRSRGRR